MKVKSKILFLLMIICCLLLINNNVEARTIYETNLKTSLASTSRELPATIDNLFYKVRILKPDTTFKYFSTNGSKIRETVVEATRDEIKGWIDYSKTNIYPLVLADIHYDSAYSISKTHKTYGDVTGYAYTTDSILYDSNGSTDLIQKFSNSNIKLSDIKKVAKTNRTVELIDYSDNISIKFFGEKSNVQSKGAYIAKDRETGELLVISYEDIFVESNVRVEKDTFPIKSIKLSEEEISVKLGENGSIYLYVLPTNSTEISNLRFNTSNKKVVDVVSSTKVANGKYELAFKTVGEGTAYLEVYLKDSDKFREKCKIIVEKDSISIKNVSINSGDFELKVGDTYQLSATVEPDNATDKDVKWSSSNSSIATISSTGKVTAKKEGTATITVKTVDGNKYDSCKVTVTKTKVPVESVSLDKKGLALGLNDTYEFTTTITPSTATNQDVKWTSSDSSVVSVTNGKITPKKPGTATITVSSVDGNKKDTCTVVVENKISVENVKINVKTLKLKVGDTYDGFEATVEPTDATNKSVIWSSNSPRIVLAYSSGTILAKTEGTATITVSSVDGSKKDTCVVIVEKNEDLEVSLNKDSVNLDIGETYTFIANVKPTNKSVKWYSNNTNVATINQSGTVVAKSEGTAIITAITESGEFDTAKVTVKNSKIAVTGVSLDKDIMTLEVGETYTFKANVKPENATNKNVKWYTTNSKVATISQNGTIETKTEGSTLITVITEDGEFAYACKVTVENSEVAVTGVSLDKELINLEVGETYTLEATIRPTNATNQDINWYSSNSKVATINKYGKIEAKSEGTAIITAITEDGKYSDTCTVNVSSKEIKVTISEDWLVLGINDIHQLTATVEPANTILKWDSSNNEVVTVNEKGVVTAISKGRATITVSTEDGKVRETCIVKVIDDIDDSPIQTIKYEITINYIINITPETNLTEFEKDIKSNTNYQIVKRNGEMLSNEENVGTGMILKTESEELVMIVKGDINGDGKITITDTVKAQLSSANMYTPTETEKMALDINGDGKITITDTVRIKLAHAGILDL